LARGRSLFRDLGRPADVFAHLGPNWFASVMGTGIVATAAATLPVQWPGLRGFATAVWVLSAMWLITVTGAEVVHWTRHCDAALGHARDPVMVQFYSAPPMALLTVGAGALLLGPGLIGSHAAITIDAVLWPLGTITGLASSLAVPYLMFTRLQAAPDAAFSLIELVLPPGPWCPAASGRHPLLLAFLPPIPAGR
jgi:tellurite resistance protein TehA-like permease